MKKLLLSVFVFCSVLINAQESNVLQWLNTNAIPVEDASQNTPLTAFSKNVPQKFKDARIFGFGEATHNTKEFFDLKAKFFKHLVETQGVNIFIMEDAYITCYKVNEWLAGRAEGDARKMAGNLGFLIWRTEEVANLLQWMKDYNTGKPTDKQIRLYGMDDQFGTGINYIVRDYVKENKLELPEELLVVADSCAAKGMFPAPKKQWSTDKIVKLKELREFWLRKR